MHSLGGACSSWGASLGENTMLSNTPISHLPGQIIPERPLWMKGSTCTNYVCLGERSELNDLCDTWFNNPLKQHNESIRITPYSDVVLVSYIQHPWAYVMNADQKAVAYHRFEELKYSFMVKVEQGGQEIGKYMFVPIKFVSRGDPMAWERQVYGIPAVKARINEKIDGKNISIHCAAFGLEKFSRESRARVITMVNASAAPKMLGAIGLLEEDKKKVVKELRKELSGKAPEGMAELLVPFQQNEFVALREFLSTSNANNAVFQDILTYRMDDLEMSAYSWLGDGFHMEFPKTTGTFELTSKILNQDSLNNVCAYQYIYNFKLAPKGFIWRAKSDAR